MRAKAPRTAAPTRLEPTTRRIASEVVELVVAAEAAADEAVPVAVESAADDDESTAEVDAVELAVAVAVDPD